MSSALEDVLVRMRWLAECSTPFGINEFCTVVEASGLDVACQCSTPFGINEFCTQILPVSPVRIVPVLNAFRHQ